MMKKSIKENINKKDIQSDEIINNKDKALIKYEKKTKLSLIIYSVIFLFLFCLLLRINNFFRYISNTIIIYFS